MCIRDSSYLRRTDHIDGSLVALEDLEHLAEETVSKQHTARLDLDSSNIVLGSYCFDLTFFRIVGDQCARRKRVHGVQQADRNVGIFGRLNTGGVQNLSLIHILPFQTFGREHTERNSLISAKSGERLHGTIVHVGSAVTPARLHLFDQRS